MRTLTTEQLRRMREDGEDFELLNVLPEAAFERQRIPGSGNAPVDNGDFVSRVERRVGDRDRRVVVYCANERCDAAPRAARKLEEAGFGEVYEYRGGMQAWREAGLPVERGA